MLYLAHAGHDEVVTNSDNLLTQIGHQPTWLSLLFIASCVVIFYWVLRASKVTFANRLLSIIPLLLGFGILYLPHNTVVTTAILSIGFIFTFLFTFTLLGRSRK